MSSMSIACVVALGTAIGLVLALPEAERLDMAAAAYITIFFNALFAAWAFAIGRSIVRMVRESGETRR